MAKEKISPGMQQYLDIKANYPDAFLLFRMGDFYELFYEDAVNAAQILEISLTSRNKKSEVPIPMAGVPYHSAQQYIDILVEQGYKVAIAEQMEDPKQAVGVVKREVVQVITPGTVVDSSKPQTDNNFLVALDCATAADSDSQTLSDGAEYALSAMDLATGEFQVTTVLGFAAACSEIRNLKAREVVVGYDLDEAQDKVLSNQMNLLLSHVAEAMEDVHLIPAGLSPLEQAVAGKLLTYVHQTQMRELSHLQPARRYQVQDYLQMDFSTKSSLDLTENARTGKKHGSLYWLMDRTKTAMGGRLLRAWIQKPLIRQDEIETRQEQVQLFLDQFFERSDLAESLKGVYDIERLVSRVAFGKINPKDMLQLGGTLGRIPLIRSILEGMNDPILTELLEEMDPITELSALIDAAIDPNAPAVITEGDIIKAGFDPTLDQYRLVMRDGTKWIADLEAREKEASGIATLRIDYNRKDGYFFHVTNSHLDEVPDHFFRKATLKNSERYGTEELTKIESQMLEAREKSATLEHDLFLRIREEVGKYIVRLQTLAHAVAKVDVLQSFATVAESSNLVRPSFTEQRVIDIVQGRHAVVEKVMGAQSYVPNSIYMDEETQLQLITGPNMSGKSTYMRQLAMTIIMAQMGSFVPAESATLPIFDAIYTRIGAADDLVSGQSTFMVEMMEANQAIQHATDRSLILFDELGRGTATYDGMALAQAIIEHIHDHNKAKTLFATHYHELTALAEALSGLENVHVATLEENGQVTFLHKIEPGPADQSYGIHVAKIAGMPEGLLARASVILEELESGAASVDVGAGAGDVRIASIDETVAKDATASQGTATTEQREGKTVSQQLDLFATEEDPIRTRLQSVDLFNLTPMQAMMLIEELKKM